MPVGGCVSILGQAVKWADGKTIFNIEGGVCEISKSNAYVIYSVNTYVSKFLFGKRRSATFERKILTFRRGPLLPIIMFA